MVTQEAIKTEPMMVATPTMVRPYGQIVVALDGSGLAEQVFAYVEPLARAFGSKVTCVCAVEPIRPVAVGEMGMGGFAVAALMETQETIRAEEKIYLAGVRERLAKQGIAVTCVEPEARAAGAIVGYAKQLKADLIAMTTHGRSGLKRTIMGSVADEVVHAAPCPVLLVRINQV